MFANFFEKRETTKSETYEKYSAFEQALLRAFGLDINTDEDALKEATYFTCIKLLSEGIAKVPCYLMKETKEGEIRAKEHYLYEKISLRPNPYMTAIDFWKAIEVNRQHTGNGCAFIERDSKGNIVNLWPVTMQRLVIDNAGLIKSNLRNKVLVEFTVVGTNTLDSCFYDDIIHLKSFTKDGLNCVSNKRMLNSTIGTNIKGQSYLNSLFDNGLTNKIIVQTTSDIKDEKELKKLQAKFDRLYSYNGRIFTVPAGVNVSSLNLSLADAQFEQIKRMSISQIAASFGIKMFQLNDLKDTNNNSLEQQQLSFLIDTLLILFEGNEQELNWKLLTDYERQQGYSFTFNTNVILRPNAETQANILSKYVTSGIYTPNEARLMLKQLKKEGGDDLVVNAGVLKLKDLGKGGENIE